MVSLQSLSLVTQSIQVHNIDKFEIRLMATMLSLTWRLQQIVSVQHYVVPPLILTTVQIYPQLLQPSSANPTSNHNHLTASALHHPNFPHHDAKTILRRVHPCHFCLECHRRTSITKRNNFLNTSSSNCSKPRKHD